MGNGHSTQAAEPKPPHSNGTEPPVRRRALGILARWELIRRGKKHWPYILLQIAALITFLCWIEWNRIPSPGVAVAIVAGLTAVMSVHPDLRPWQKFIYLVLIGAFLFTEFRAIRKDRYENQQEQHALLEKQQRGFETIIDETQQNFEATNHQAQEDFSATAEGLKSAYLQSQRGFNATMGGISKSIDTFTGGTSYLWLSYDQKYNTLVFIHKGDYPVYRAIVRIVNLDSVPPDLIGTTMQLQDVTPDHAISEPGPPGLLTNSDRIDLNIFFSSLNGDWIESLRERRVDNRWHAFMRIEGYFYSSTGKGKILCEDVDKDFPLDTIEKELRVTAAPKPPSCARSAK